MRAFIPGSGLHILLSLQDKLDAESASQLECVVDAFKKPRVVLYIVDEELKNEMLEEPGFHAEVTPRNRGPEERTQYDIYLTREHFRKITNPEEDPVIIGGHFTSRCRLDRVDISYFGV